MPVEDLFTLRDGRTVVTGRVERGRVRPGDALELVGLRAGRTHTVTAVERFGASTAGAEAGDNVALQLRGVDRREHAERGQVLATPGSVAARSEFEALVHIRSEEEVGRAIAFPTTRQGRFMLRTADLQGEILALRAGHEDLREARPGLATMTVRLSEAVPLERALRLTMRDRTGSGVADGVVTRVLA